MSIELLSMLSPNSTNISHIPGGIPKITPQDVSAAIGLCDLTDHADHFIRTKYILVGEEQAKALNSGKIQHTIMNLVHNEGGSRLNPITVKRFSNFVVRSDITPNNCQHCNRTGIAPNWTMCVACDGTGMQKLTIQAKANILGVHKSTYDRTWKPHEGMVLSLFRSWESEFGRMLNNRMRG